MKNKTIKIISCGGTFEKIYDPISGNLTFNQSGIADLIKRSRISEKITLNNIMLIDSLDMTDKHRKKIAKAVFDSEEKKILLIHGTDTMVETAKELAKSIKDNKTIVITGAMIPASIKNSDAPFNFGFSIAALHLLKSGVWITMNGTIFQHDEVKKNIQKGIFEKKINSFANAKG